MNKILFFCSIVLLSSCHSKQNDNSSPSIEVKGDTITIPSNAAVFSKLELLTINMQNYSSEFNATGTVRPVPGQLAQIAVPFDGRITKSFVQLGQKVNAGSPIFEMSSSEYYEDTKHYMQASQAEQLADKNLQRQKDLVKHGVGAQKDLEEAQTNCEIAKQELENAASVLRVLNVNPSKIGEHDALKIVSPIAGEVVQNNTVIGQFIKNDAEPLVIVAELSKVWVVAQVKEQYLNQLHLQDKVEIHKDVNPAKVIYGEIYHIGELLDEATRSVQVTIKCDNADRTLKPGMFAEIHFVNTPSPAILIPSTAILQSEAKSYVFVQLAKGKFLKRTVKVSTVGDGQSLVSEGLHVGDIIVSKGSIYLMGN